MSHIVSGDREKRVEVATRSLEEMMRRIEPFIRRPKEGALKKRQNWSNSDQGNYRAGRCRARPA